MQNINERLIVFWLGAYGGSVKRINAILNECSPIEVWEGVRSSELSPFFGEKAFTSLKSMQNIDLLNKRLQDLAAKDITVLTRVDKEFPKRLSQAEINPPIVLYCRGNLSLLDTPCVAIVGSRACTQYGKEITQRFTEELVLGGLTIVSGMATGIDTYAHAQALASGGKTIAVLGGGFDHIYPAENNPLFNRMISSGNLVMTEYAPETRPTGYTFPERNRIVSGLSLAVIVTEAKHDSGALITANLAIDQGRELFCVPGRINSKQSEGCNNLLLNKRAHFTISTSQVFDELKLSVPEVKKNKCVQLDIFEQAIYSVLQNGALPFDEIVHQTKLSPQDASVTLTALELKALVKRLPSNFYSITAS